MKIKFRKIAALALSSIMMIAFTACGSKAPKQDNSTANVDKMFNVVLTGAFTGFDPLRTNDTASTYVTSQIYETLYRIGEDGKYVPLLAESLPEFSQDGLTATIKLRSGIKFHDGTPFNAEAVKYTFELIKNPDFGSARASLAASIESIEAVDETTVKFKLLYQDGVLTAKLAHTNSAIVSPTAQKAQDLMTNPVGTGPYKFVSSVSGANVVLTRNEEYWGEKGIIKDVTMTVIAEEATALARLETGEADFMPTLSVGSIARVETMKNVYMGTADSAQMYYVALRPNSYVNPLMANKDFRTAIIKSLDREGFVKYVMEDHATNAKSVIGPKVFGYTKEGEAKNIAFDLEGAKALVEKNGWANEKISFLVPSTPAYAPMGEYFQANLKAAGFNNVVLESIEWSAWLTEAKAENRFDITVAAWSNVTRDGTELLEPNWGSKASARTKINSEEFDKYVYESKTTSDSAKRIEYLQKANAYLLESAVVAPIYNSEIRYVCNNAFQASINNSNTFFLYEFKTK